MLDTIAERLDKFRASNSLTNEVDSLLAGISADLRAATPVPAGLDPGADARIEKAIEDLKAPATDHPDLAT